jgi:hemolysin activation/secretion protein
LADISISKGLAWPGATDNGADRTRSVGEQEYTKSNVSLTRLQNLPANFSIMTEAAGQFTSQALLQSEQMTLGGTEFGRAYDTGEIAGDSGIAGKAELRYTHILNNGWLNSFQLYSYYDAGALYTNRVSAGTPSEQSLTSAGGGIRLNLVRNLYGYTEVAVPLTRTVASENNKDPRIFFSLSAQF